MAWVTDSTKGYKVREAAHTCIVNAPSTEAQGCRAAHHFNGHVT